MDNFANAQERYAATAWESERLVYRGLLDSDKDWFFSEHRDEPIVFAMGDPTMMIPQSQFGNEKLWTMAKDGPMGVIVCLKAEEEARLAAEDEGAKALAAADPTKASEEKKDGEKNGTSNGAVASTDAKKKPLTRLGFVALFNGTDFPVSNQRRMELGISFTRSVRGRGFGSEAINWILDRAFIDMNLHKVYLNCFEFNTRAIHTYKKVGFHLDGTFRDSYWFQRRYWDGYQYSMLEQEWEELRCYKAIEKGDKNGVNGSA
jgi:RimJ/RimL family protein N-acetyltransferase